MMVRLTAGYDRPKRKAGRPRKVVPGAMPGQLGHRNTSISARADLIAVLNEEFTRLQANPSTPRKAFLDLKKRAEEGGIHSMVKRINELLDMPA